MSIPFPPVIFCLLVMGTLISLTLMGLFSYLFHHQMYDQVHVITAQVIAVSNYEKETTYYDDDGQYTTTSYHVIIEYNFRFEGLPINDNIATKKFSSPEEAFRYQRQLSKTMTVTVYFDQDYPADNGLDRYINTSGFIAGIVIFTLLSMAGIFGSVLVGLIIFVT